MEQKPLHTRSLSRAWIFFGAWLCLLSSQGSAQLLRIYGDAMNGWQQERRGPQSSLLIEQSYSQYYILGVTGYIYSPKLLMIDIASSFSDVSTKFGYETPSGLRTSRDIGYYNASATLFPNNGFRMTVHGRRQQLDYTNSSNSILFGATGAQPQTLQNVDTYGVDVHVPPNTYYPGIDASLQRDLRKCIDPCTELYRRVDMVRMSLENSSTIGSSYRADYLGQFTRDLSEAWSTNDHQVYFTGRSEVSERMTVHATGRMQLRDQYATRNVDLIGDMLQSPTVRHRFRASSSDNRTTGLQTFRGNRSLIEHMMFSVPSESFHWSAGAAYQSQTTSMGVTEQASDKAVLRLQGEYRYMAGDFVVTTEASTEDGLESGYNEGRRFVQRSGLGTGSTYTFGYLGRVELRDDVTYETAVNGEASARNAVRAVLNSTALPTLPATVSVTRTDDAFWGKFSVVRPSATFLEGEAMWTPAQTFFLRAYHSERFSSGLYSDRTSRSLLHLMLRGVLRNLDASAQAERMVSTLTGTVSYRYNAELRYRFYAFSLSARYDRTTSGLLSSDKVIFEVRRPIGFDLH